MAIKFNQFTTGDTTNTLSADYLVGYESTQDGVAGGERKWTVATIANAVSGVMNEGGVMVTKLDASAPITLSQNNGDILIEIDEAAETAPGTMSAEDKRRLNDASSVSGIVKCDGNGNFSVVTSSDIPTAPGIVVDVLLLAGGGAGGGENYGGGGGAGGYTTLSKTLPAVAGRAYTISIGAGGARSSSAVQGAPGITSSINGVDLSMTCSGGGGGGGGSTTSSRTGGGGGSGGGGSLYSGAGGAGSTGQGYKGGTGVISGSDGMGGGGGGAGSVGVSGTTSGGGGTGGSGLNWLSLGTFYGGGGGGSTVLGDNAIALGGSSMGGSGARDRAPTAAGGSGVANRGSGGGGGTGYGCTTCTPGNGSSGIAIIRYAGAARGTGGTINADGGYTYHTFNSSGTFTITS